MNHLPPGGAFKTETEALNEADMIHGLRYLTSMIERSDQVKSFVERTMRRGRDQIQVIVDCLSIALDSDQNIVPLRARAFVYRALVEIAFFARVFAQNHTFRPEFVAPDIHLEATGVYRVLEDVCGNVKLLKRCNTETSAVYTRPMILWAHISHPNILPLYAVFLEDDDKPVLLYPLYEAQQNIREFTQEHPKFGRMPLITDVANGISYIHSLGVVHGGLVPKSIMITCDKRAVIDMDPNLSTFLSVCYSAPELLKGEEVSSTQATDMWALSCLIYEVLSDNEPFSEITKEYLASVAIVTEKMPKRPGCDGFGGRDIDDVTWQLLQKCWTPLPKDRLVASRFHRALLAMSVTDDRPARQSILIPHAVKGSIEDATAALSQIIGSNRSLSLSPPVRLYRSVFQLCGNTINIMETIGALKDLSLHEAQVFVDFLDIVFKDIPVSFMAKLPLEVLLVATIRATQVIPRHYKLNAIHYHPTPKRSIQNVSTSFCPCPPGLMPLIQMSCLFMEYFEKNPPAHQEFLLLLHLILEEIYNNMHLCFHKHPDSPWLRPALRITPKSIRQQIVNWKIVDNREPLTGIHDRAVWAKRYIPDIDFDQTGHLLMKLLQSRLSSLLGSHTNVKALVMSILRPDILPDFVDFLDLTLREHNCTVRDRTRVLTLLLDIVSSGTRTILPRRLELSGIKYNPCHIAKGGSGLVHQGVDLDVCVKVCQNVDQRALTLWIRELVLWSHMSHPNILPLLGVLIERTSVLEQFSLVSPFMKNGNLCEYAPKLPQGSRLVLIFDVINGLAYLHESNIVHGDLKGQNVLISNVGRGVITDFGSTRITAASATVTATRVPITLQFAAPEVVSGHSPTKEHDIWSFGCLTYETISRLRPYYQYYKDVQIQAAILRKERPRRPEINEPMDDNLWDDSDEIDFDEIDDQAWNLITRCCAPEPWNRPQPSQIKDIIFSMDNWGQQAEVENTLDPGVSDYRVEPEMRLDVIERLMDEFPVKMGNQDPPVPLLDLFQIRRVLFAADSIFEDVGDEWLETQSPPHNIATRLIEKANALLNDASNNYGVLQPMLPAPGMQPAPSGSDLQFGPPMFDLGLREFHEFRRFLDDGLPLNLAFPRPMGKCLHFCIIGNDRDLIRLDGSSK
ncbi:hypothetical protein NP233_g9178 [Leucocoprinus birnbaumii]|uniref:Protein kinase domain-containing protein n=1 Tax=Leucocoprinus birnbaumii TaxID=56174 RepID=A0AAD5VLH9_9AGAR|nr:hypothetical protein NP233_g9178 [Leucocoprinus birnbaumii]